MGGPESRDEFLCGTQRREHSGHGAPTGPACPRAQEKGPCRPRRGLALPRADQFPPACSTRNQHHVCRGVAEAGLPRAIEEEHVETHTFKEGHDFPQEEAESKRSGVALKPVLHRYRPTGRHMPERERGNRRKTAA